VKFPLSSVVVPTVVPLICTDNLPKLTPEAFLTFPEMDDVWARTTVETKTKIREANTLPTRFIRSLFGFIIGDKIGIVKFLPKKELNMVLLSLFESAYRFTLAP
jgi:hypothetical protein